MKCSIPNLTNLSPKNSDAYGNRAVAKAAIGEDTESEKDKEEAIKFGATYVRIGSSIFGPRS